MSKRGDDQGDAEEVLELGQGDGLKGVMRDGREKRWG